MDFLKKGNWKQTDYFEKTAPNIPAIYVVVFNNELLYVGCTNNLKQRLYFHEVIKRICKVYKIRESLTINYLKTKSRNIKFESFLIKKYKPKFNGGVYCYWGNIIKKKLNGKSVQWLIMELRMPDLSRQMRGLKPFKREELKLINLTLSLNCNLRISDPVVLN